MSVELQNGFNGRMKSKDENIDNSGINVNIVAAKAFEFKRQAPSAVEPSLSYQLELVDAEPIVDYLVKNGALDDDASWSESGRRGALLEKVRSSPSSLQLFVTALRLNGEHQLASRMDTSRPILIANSLGYLDKQRFTGELNFDVFVAAVRLPLSVVTSSLSKEEWISAQDYEEEVNRACCFGCFSFLKFKKKSRSSQREVSHVKNKPNDRSKLFRLHTLAFWKVIDEQISDIEQLICKYVEQTRGILCHHCQLMDRQNIPAANCTPSELLDTEKVHLQELEINSLRVRLICTQRSTLLRLLSDNIDGSLLRDITAILVTENSLRRSGMKGIRFVIKFNESDILKAKQELL